MRRSLLTLALGLGLALGQVHGDAQQDFEQAKKLMFDRQWSGALPLLGQVLRQREGNRHYWPAFFYKARCLQETGQQRAALPLFEEYSRQGDNAVFREEANIAIIDLALALAEKGDRSQLGKLQERLCLAEKVVRYYAALKMSYWPDRAQALAAVPVLREMIEAERDDELRDRAKIALLRLQPASLPAESGFPSGLLGRTLRIRIFEAGKKNAAVSLDVPLALGDLALRALVDNDAPELKKLVGDSQGFLQKLIKRQGSILEFREDGNLVKIWIE